MHFAPEDQIINYLDSLGGFSCLCQAVGSGRSATEVRLHAHDYFVNLQMVTQVSEVG